MSKILVIGANGQLESEIREIVKGQNKSNFIFTDNCIAAGFPAKIIKQK